MIAPVPPRSAATAAIPPDVRRAAQAFEAIFVRQMLAAARASHFDDGGLFAGEGIRTFRQMQDDRFAEIAAGAGGFGMADIIAAQLAGGVTPQGSR